MSKDMDKTVAKETEFMSIAPSPEQIDAIYAGIDISNATSIMSFGSEAQNQLTQTSESMLENVRAKDVGEAGDMLNQMVGKLRDFEVPKVAPGQPTSWWRRIVGLKGKFDMFLDDYADLRDQVEEIADGLERHKGALQTDIISLDRLYEANLDYFRLLNAHIEAASRKMHQLDEHDIPALREQASEGDNMALAQQLRDLQTARDEMDRRLHDLRLTRQVTMQTLPSIRLVQENDKALVNKIDSVMTNTLPLWKQQLAVAVTIHRSGGAAKAVKAASDLTNDLLVANAEHLQEGTKVVRSELERGVFDAASVDKANNALIASLETSANAAADGRARRREAEEKLQDMENKLRHALAEIAQN